MKSKKQISVAELYRKSNLACVPIPKLRFMCLALIHENQKLRILIDGKWDKLNWKKLREEYP